MKKKLLLLAVLVLGILICGYFYIYKSHRDVAAASADFTFTVADLQQEFTTNDSLANLKYQDKVVQINGIITTVEPESKSIVIDEKVFAAFDTALPKEIKSGMKITLKGRFLGYDDLLEEFRIDQSSVIE